MHFLLLIVTNSIDIGLSEQNLISNGANWLVLHMYYYNYNCQTMLASFKIIQKSFVLYRMMPFPIHSNEYIHNLTPAWFEVEKKKLHHLFD